MAEVDVLHLWPAPSSSCLVAFRGCRWPPRALPAADPPDLAGWSVMRLHGGRQRRRPQLHLRPPCFNLRTSMRRPVVGGRSSCRSTGLQAERRADRPVPVTAVHRRPAPSAAAPVFQVVGIPCTSGMWQSFSGPRRWVTTTGATAASIGSLASVLLPVSLPSAREPSRT